MEQTAQTQLDAAPAAPAASAPDTTPAAPAPAAAPASEPAAPAAPAASADPATAAAGPAKPAEPSAPQGAPEKYEFKPAEGINLGDEVIGKFAEVAKELNLSQEGAQKILSDVAPMIAKQQAEAFKATVEGWAKDAQADKEIGGDKFTENVALARKGIDAHFSPEFVKLLNDTGLGNHPEMIRGFMKIGQLVSQDKFVPSSVGANPLGSAADKLYGSNS